MNYLLSSFVLLLLTQPAISAELSPGNLVGRYKVEAKAGFQRVYLNFRVLNTREFEIQRTYSDGRVDESCDGTYGLSPSLFRNLDLLAAGKIFNGVFTCPSNRSKEMDFNIDFRNTTTEDLTRGTTVTVTSSMAPGMRINAYVKKQ